MPFELCATDLVLPSPQYIYTLHILLHYFPDDERNGDG